MVVRVFRAFGEQGSVMLLAVPPFHTLDLRLTGEVVTDWTPWTVERIYTGDPGEKRLRDVDLPAISSHQPVVNARARDVLAPLFNKSGQFLPLHVDGDPLWVFNVTTVLEDSLDYEDSDVRRFDSGRPYEIMRYAFHKSAVENEPIFKLAELPKAPFYIGQEVVDAVTQAGLTGWTFREIWNDVDGPQKIPLF